MDDLSAAKPERIERLQSPEEIFEQNVFKGLSKFLDTEVPHAEENLRKYVHNFAVILTGLMDRHIKKRPGYKRGIDALLMIITQQLPSQSSESFRAEGEALASNLIEAGILKKDNAEEIRAACLKAIGHG